MQSYANYYILECLIHCQTAYIFIFLYMHYALNTKGFSSYDFCVCSFCSLFGCRGEAGGWTCKTASRETSTRDRGRKIQMGAAASQCRNVNSASLCTVWGWLTWLTVVGWVQCNVTYIKCYCFRWTSWVNYYNCFFFTHCMSIYCSVC